MEQYHLFRSDKGKDDWKSTTKGDMKYILSLLELNLQEPTLKGIEWKIVPVS